MTSAYELLRLLTLPSSTLFILPGCLSPTFCAFRQSIHQFKDWSLEYSPKAGHGERPLVGVSSLIYSLWSSKEKWISLAGIQFTRFRSGTALGSAAGNSYFKDKREKLCKIPLDRLLYCPLCCFVSPASWAGFPFKGPRRYSRFQLKPAVPPTHQTFL